MDANVFNRMENETSYYEERLRVIFRVAYRHGDRAFTAWQGLCEKRGFDKAHEALKDNPQSLGKLKGHLILGFKKTQERRDAELVLDELQHFSKKHHLLKLQLEEARQLLTIQKTQAEQQKRQNQAEALRQESTQSETSVQVKR